MENFRANFTFLFENEIKSNKTCYMRIVCTLFTQKYLPTAFWQEILSLING